MSCRRFSGPLPQVQTMMSCRRFSGPLPQVQTNVMQTVLGSAPSSADYDVMQAVLGSAPSVSAHALSRCIGPQPHWRALGIEVGTALNEGAARPPLGGCIIASPPISFRSVASSRRVQARHPER